MSTRADTQSPALPAADSHELIRVHGARENNLKDVSVEIPKRRLTAFNSDRVGQRCRSYRAERMLIVSRLFVLAGLCARAVEVALV